jgi:catechol 2,3-dioxygenase-like lactoylglutathione lyase family enzyme
MPLISGALHSHTTLECLDIEETLRFYRDALGLSTARHLAKAGLFCSTNHHVTANIEDPNGPFDTTMPSDAESTSIVPAGPVSYVTLEVRDVDQTFAFYRDVLGLDVALRDGAIHYAGHGGVNLIAVPAAGDVLPQPVLNHHGLTLGEHQHDAVRALHTDLKAGADEYGVLKVMGASSQHGSFSFYFQDRDTNWWELETLEGGLDPWQRATLPDGDARLLEAARGASTIRTAGAPVPA